MLPSDLTLCQLCADTYTNTSVFDYVDVGAQSGVWAAVKYVDGYDIVACRGSDDIPDWEHDFEAAMVDIPNMGKVHSGMVRNVGVAVSNIQPHLRGLPIIYTGHSLGGPHCLYISKALTVPSITARIVVFGCPRPGDEAFRDSFKSINLTSYRNTQKDPVPHVPLYIPPEFDYFDISLSPVWVDGLSDNTWDDAMKYHHIQSYMKGLEACQNIPQITT